MALVCDLQSESVQPSQEEQTKNFECEATETPTNDDLEDGEIEDDDEEVTEPAILNQPESPPPSTLTLNKFTPNENKFPHRNSRFDRLERHNRYDDRKRGHLTEAEKSVQHLHKLERLEREKRERYKREQQPVVDDFASNIEKAIANVLKKDKKLTSDDEKEEEEKRGRKRKKKDKDKKKLKQRRMGSPKIEEFDENEPLNVGKGSPDGQKNPQKNRTRSPSPHSDYDSFDSSTSSDHSKEDKKDWKKDRGKKRSHSHTRDRIGVERKNRDKNREQKTDGSFKESRNQDSLCVFYLQGKCNKGDDCPYSHEVAMPMKLELCKFYLMDCCAKRDKCLYMHSEFPCKFYHMGLRCQAGDNCKFAHGRPLHEGLKQILFKHIETAPKEILGEFPRLSREGALNMINQAQKALQAKYLGDSKDAANMDSGRGIIPSLFELNIPVPTELLTRDGDGKFKEKKEKPMARERNRPSRWQDAEPMDSLALHDQQGQLQMTFGLKGFYSERGDQDMRINSNGDIDMRTLPPQLNPLVSNIPKAVMSPSALNLSGDNTIMNESSADVDIRTRPPQDIDIRQISMESPMNLLKDVDIRQITPFDLGMSNTDNDDNDNAADEPNLQIVVEEEFNVGQKSEEGAGVKEDFEDKDADNRGATDFLPANLPKKQRELFLRIQAQQKENVPENQKDVSDEDKNIDWYSDDDDDCRLTIKDDIEDAKPQSEEAHGPAPQVPSEVIEKLGDLSKIDISEEVTKLLSSISQSNVLNEKKNEPLRDPRLAAQTAEPIKLSPVLADPRRARMSSTESKKPEKISIYEQGSMSLETAVKDVDLRNIDRDLDMRPVFGDTDLRPAPGRPDIDLRQLNLPFKAIQNYTPASEIDASINSHAPMPWKVHIVDIPRPDYTGLKLSAHDAQSTGDPRLRKIFRLSTEEKDSPASPKENTSKPVVPVRTDPRRRREEKPTSDVSNQMNYAQQLSLLQASPFYQSLTSSQKVLLNQELATRSDHSGSNDPTLNGILTNLGLVPGPSIILPNSTAANASALNILANVNNMNPLMGQTSLVQSAGLMTQNQPQSFVTPTINPNMLAQNPNIVNQMAQSIVQPGLLGAAPGVPNLTPEFQLNFDPRQGGLLGNAPPMNFNNNSNYNYNDDFYEEGNNFNENGGGVNARGGGRGSGGRGMFRDRQPRRGRNFNNSNNRNSSGRNFRSRNRSTRSRTPP